VEIKDVRDEIKIILSVLHKQQEAMGDLKDLCEPKYRDVFDKHLPHDIVKANIDEFTKLDSQALAVQDKVS
jgi:molybdopterin converting factor small subunit